MKTDCIEYRRLPGQSPLFLGYVEGSDPVRDWYPVLPGPELDDEALLEQSRRARDTVRFERTKLLSAMSRTRERLNAPGAGELMARLESEDCVAVVTGQQVGLFGGPAYSVYKAISAVRLARRLEELGQPAVPVFWLASDDSDFDEVRSTFFAPEDELIEVRYPRGTDDAEMAGPVKLDAIGELLETPPAGVELNGLRRFYRPEADFREAFGSWMAHLFEKEGLLFFDPLADGFRQELEPFFRRAITGRDEITSRLLERGRDLKAAGYEPQVHVDEAETLLFWVEDGRRYKLEFVDGRFQAKGRRSLSMSPDELLAKVAEDPGCVSANALLRPLLQEYLLPTVVTIGGPGEVAYFSQLGAIAPLWDCQPAVLPRAAFTLVDRQVQRLLERHGIEVGELLDAEEGQLAERLLRGQNVGPTLERFDRLQASLEEELATLRRDVAAHDPTVSAMLENSSRKIFYQLDKVQKRLVANSAQADATLRRHLGLLTSRLRPRGGVQERLLNFNQFLNEEPRLVERLLEVADPTCRQHQIVYL